MPRTGACEPLLDARCAMQSPRDLLPCDLNDPARHEALGRIRRRLSTTSSTRSRNPADLVVDAELTRVTMPIDMPARSRGREHGVIASRTGRCRETEVTFDTPPDTFAYGRCRVSSAWLGEVDRVVDVLVDPRGDREDVGSNTMSSAGSRSRG
jgi:hypothetical protein